jgi:arsenite methyltransferase
MKDRPRPDYGLDAPGVVRNLFVCGALGLALWGVVAQGHWSGVVVLGPIAGVELRFPLAAMGLWAGGSCVLMGLWMLWSGRIGKVRRREKLLGNLSWTGGERVLDVGCGRGLMLLGAAKRLSGGKAFGIDIWQAEDLSGNRPSAVLENARREGVLDRIRIEAADMRRLPFGDGAFDVVVSSQAIHNVYSAAGRAEAIGEIARVLKPGGRALIEDIRHQTEYARTFAESGCADVARIGSPLATVLLAVVTMGSLRPGTLLVRKTG